MGRRLRMSAEIGDWLAELCAGRPADATEVGAVLAVLLDGDELAGPPLVNDLGADEPVDLDDYRAALDDAYRDMLSALQLLRRAAADAGSLQARTRISPAGSSPVPYSEQELAEAKRREQELNARSQRCQRAVDSFRTSKEAVKARLTAAQAGRDIQRALLAQAEAERAGAELSEAERAGAELAGAEQELAAAAAEAAALRRAIAAELSAENLGAPAPQVVAGLLEIRADPLGADIRLLAAAEPPGTLTLLAVLDGHDAVTENRRQAIELAGELLTEIRAGDWPPEHPARGLERELTLTDQAAFLDMFFAGRSGEVSERAAIVGAACTLAGLRRKRGRSRADLAGRVRMPEDELWALEHNDLGSARIAALGSYVRGLGGRLELTAIFDDAQPTPLS